MVNKIYMVDTEYMRTKAKMVSQKIGFSREDKTVVKLKFRRASYSSPGQADKREG